MTELALDYTPRPQFIKFHQRSQQLACMVCHRGAGKTVACVHDLLDKAIELSDRNYKAASGGGREPYPRPRFAYIAPYYGQAKTTAWDYLRTAVAPLAPHGLIIHESELRVGHPDGWTVRLFGADNYNALRGAYWDGVVFDEYGDMDPRVWSEVVSPRLGDRGIGWATFIGTPRGKNHFARLWEEAHGDPEWYTMMLKASESGIYSPERLEFQRKTKTENQYRQEMECDFDAAVLGCYFGQQIIDMRNQKRLGHVAADPLMAYRAFWDIGGTGAKADHTAIWIAQFIGREIRVVDYYEAQGQPLAAHVNWLRNRGYAQALCVLPHDGATQDRVHSVSYESYLRAAEFEVQIVPNQGRGAALVRVEAARRRFPLIWMNEETCIDGLNALAGYHAKMDEKRNIDLGPEHDWASHAADAFGMMCVVYEEPRVKSREKHYVSNRNSSWLSV